MEDLAVKQKRFKEKIEMLVNQNKLLEARQLVEAYDQMVPEDIDIYAIKGVMAMMEGNMKEGLAAIEKGLQIDPDHIDLLYNKAYLYTQVGEYKQSYGTYKRVLELTDEQPLRQEINQKLKQIEKIDRSVHFTGKLSLLAAVQGTPGAVIDFMAEWLSEFGFTLLKSIAADVTLDTKRIKNCLILYDLNPQQMQPAYRKKYPDIDNARYFLRESLQKVLLEQFGKEGADCFCYTKNEREAKQIMDILLGEKKQAVLNRMQAIEEAYSTQYPVLRLFDGFKHRAKIELVRYKGGLAVKKTFKPGNEKYLEREKFACGTLSKTIPYIPPMLDCGKNYIMMPYYKNVLDKSLKVKKRILVTHIMDIADFLKRLYEAGYFHADMHPGNFIYTKQEGLKVIDFEYLQPYEKKPATFAQSWDIVGCPKDFQGDRPNYVGKNLHQVYDRLWVKHTGYNLGQIAQLGARGKYEMDDPEINKALELLHDAKKSGKSYNGCLYESAYHSLTLKGYYFRGQREPNLRLQNFGYDFSQKTVLDLGCNAGGMLHALAHKIKRGIGLDYDFRLIRAANAIKAVNQCPNLYFYQFDLEKEDLASVKKLLGPESHGVDICFLLSICVWIKNWRQVIAFIASISNHLLFEANGTPGQQRQQIQELERHFYHVDLIEKESLDDPNSSQRQLIFCRS